MAPIAAISAVVLICIATAQGFKKDIGDSTHSVHGIYDGRFGLDGIKISAVAVFNMGGVVGSVAFSQPKPGDPVQVHVNLVGLDQFPDAYPWTVHNYPVRSSILNDFPCINEFVGGVFDDLGAADRNGPLNYEEPWQSFFDSDISLSGSDSIIGRSLVIDRQFGTAGDFICANIEQVGAKREILRAAFDNDIIQGEVVIRYAKGRDDATVEVDIVRTDGAADTTGNTWSLHYGTVSSDNSCNDTLDAIFGSSNAEGDDHGPDFNCGSDSTQRECRIGDLTSKCGALDFVGGQIHSFCVDTQIGTIPRSYLFDEGPPQHSLVVAIRDANGNPLGCAPLEMVAPITARSQFRSISIFGDFLFWQTGPDDRTSIQAHVTGLRNDVDYSLRIYENVLPMNEPCTFEALGNVITRQNGEFFLPADAASGAVGSLDALIPLQSVTYFRDTVTTNTLPLFGHSSILDRTLALVREDTNTVVACSTIMRQGRYPQGEIASLQGFQNLNNPPLPPIPSYSLPG